VNGSASTNGTVTLVQANTWTWLSVVGQYTAGSTSLSVIIGVDDGPPPQAGDTQDFTGLIVEYLDGTKPAVPASGSYFDGDTPDDAANLVDYSWTGTAGASTSQRAVGLGIHVKLRRAMLIENPGGTTLLHFDGSTPGNGEHNFAWTGTAHASTSTDTMFA